MAPDFSKLNKEDLIKVVEKLRARKKYGLIWDEERTKEKFEKEAENALPVLREIASKKLTSSPGDLAHILIEGDNYHTLSVLNYTHQGKVDVIYIDPPYNTGAKDWKYNNHYVESTDTYRHSKWLSMMKKRLLLAKNVLADDGIICVTIDDYEVARLTLLMEELFGEINHLGTIVIKNNPSGRSTEKGFSIAHEYALFFSKSPKASIGRLERNENQIARYGERDNLGSFEWVNFRKHGATREESPAMFYPIYLTKRRIRIPMVKWNEKKREWIVLEKVKGNETIVLPIDDHGFERRWKWSIERAQREIREMKVGVDRNGNLAVYIKSRLNEEGMLPLTWWDNKLYSATAYGTNLIKEMFSKLQAFSYPKSLWAVRDCLKVMSQKKSAVILDFFAGSGTTGHAVLEMNKADGGSRQFILCTNNENGIATDVCLPRIKKAIEGYKTPKGEKIMGLGGNLRYFKTAFVKNSLSQDDLKIRITNECTEMLCLREGIFDEIKANGHYRIFKTGNRIMAVYYSLDRKGIVHLKKELDKLDGDKVLYCFTLDPLGLDKKDFDSWDNISLEPIPQKILDIYEEIYEYKS